VVALVKPQFEAGKDQVPRGGVIRDPQVHRAVLERVPAASAGAGLSARRLTASPITGGDGNREFLVLFDREPPAADDWAAQIDAAMGERA
jgi:23S rRNA (cytidine1920-2'-O)/16S rRNA (cytidine1409-2'-O)-methyltransferase